MNTAIKLGLGLGVAGVLFIALRRGADLAKQYADKVTFRLSSFSRPRIDGGAVSLPITIEVNNPAPVSIPIQKIKVYFSTLRYGQYIDVGSTNEAGPFTITPGLNNLPITPTLNLKALNPLKSVGSALDQINNIVKGGSFSLPVKVDVDITIAGFTTRITETQNVNLLQL